MSEWTFLLCALNLRETFQIWREKSQTLRLMCVPYWLSLGLEFSRAQNNQSGILHGSLQQLKNSSFVVRKGARKCSSYYLVSETQNYFEVLVKAIWPSGVTFRKKSRE